MLAAGVFTSTAGILLRWVEQADGWQVLFYRSLSFTLALLAFVALRHRGGLVQVFREIGRPGLIAAVSLAVAFSSFVFALLATSVANVVFILSLSPFLAGLFAWIALREPVRAGLFAAMAVALLGVGIMVAGGIARGALAGNLFALLSCIGYAIALTAFRQRKAVDMLPSVCLAGALSTLAAACFVETFAVTVRDLGLSVTLGVVQLGLQYVLITIGARHVPAAEVALLARVQVVLAPIWVWLGVGEVPALATFVGGGIVLMAVMVHAVRTLADERPAVSGL